jgi:CHAT domain-containing protein
MPHPQPTPQTIALTLLLFNAIVTPANPAIAESIADKKITDKNIADNAIVNQIQYSKTSTKPDDFYSWLEPPTSDATPNLTKPAIDNLLQRSKTTPTTQILNRIQLLKQCLKQYSAIGDQAGLNQVKLEQVSIAYRQAQYKDAQRLLTTLQFKFTPNTPEYFKFKSLSGLLKLESGDLQSALSDLLTARSQQPQDFISEQLNTTGIAEAYYRLGKYRNGIDLALLVSRNGADRVSQAKAFQILGDISFDLGKPEEAIDYYQKSAQMSESIGAGGGLRNYNSTTISLIQLGRVYQSLNRLDDARTRITEGLQNAQQQFNNHKTVILALNAAANFQLETQNAPQALKYLQEAEFWVKNTDDPIARLITQGTFGRYYETISDYDRALAAYTDAIAQAERMGDRATEAKLRSAYGQTLLKKKRLKPAIESLEKSINLFESLRPRLIDSERIAIAEQQSKTYALLESAQVQNDDPKAALLTTERARARAFVELLATRHEGQPMADSLSELTAHKATTLAEIQATATANKATIVTYSIVNQLHNPSLESELHTWVIQPNGTVQFHKSNLTSNLTLNPLTANSPQPSLEETVYNTLRQITLRSSKTRASIAIEGTSTSENSLNTTDLQSAHKLLIAPIQKWLPKNDHDRIIIIPQGSLLLVPFAALQDETGKFLIERHTLQIAPSIQSLALLKSNRSPNRNPLIVGNPFPMADEFDPLPGSEQEANAIASLLNTHALTGKNATKNNILNKISNTSLIHFATHGLMDERSGLESAIVLSNSGTRGEGDRITASEILSLNLTANLVVLSACNTGRGKITGDGVIGLSRSFMSAGVPSVVVSLWQVPDAPTSALMIAFHQNLTQNPDKAQALRQAMLKTLKTYPQPRDWAGFMLVGRAE